MSKFTDLHLELEIKAKDFRENPTDENLVFIALIYNE